MIDLNKILLPKLYRGISPQTLRRACRGPFDSEERRARVRREFNVDTDADVEVLMRFALAVDPEHPGRAAMTWDTFLATCETDDMVIRRDVPLVVPTLWARLKQWIRPVEPVERRLLNRRPSIVGKPGWQKRFDEACRRLVRQKHIAVVTECCDDFTHVRRYAITDTAMAYLAQIYGCPSTAELGSEEMADAFRLFDRP